MKRRAGLVRILCMACFCTAIFLGVSVAPAGAINCSVPHCYSITRADTGGTYYTGAWMQTTAQFMTPGEGSPPGPFINSEFWVLNSSQTAWAEAGLTNGVVNGGPIAYQTFYAYGTGGGSYYAEFTRAYLTPDGSTHTFQISRAGSVNYWLVTIDGIGANTNNLGFWSSNHMQVGAELASTNSLARANTFVMVVNAINGSGARVAFPATGSTVDHPCPGTGCFNYGWSPAFTAHSWNKQQG